MVPALGNHDTFKADNYPDFKTGGSGHENFYDKYLEEAALADFITGDAKEMFKKCGYYHMTKPTRRTQHEDVPKIKFVVLNTNLYYHNQYDLDPVDPCDQLKWLRATLEEPLDNSTRVIVVGHVPPGFFARDSYNMVFNVPCNGECINDEFASIFRNKSLSSGVAAQLYGHDHLDTFRLFRDEVSETVRSSVFMAASVTPALYLNNVPMGVNPSVRIYSYDDERGIIMDYDQVICPMKAVYGIIYSTYIQNSQAGSFTVF